MDRSFKLRLVEAEAFIKHCANFREIPLTVSDRHKTAIIYNPAGFYRLIIYLVFLDDGVWRLLGPIVIIVRTVPGRSTIGHGQHHQARRYPDYCIAHCLTTNIFIHFLIQIWVKVVRKMKYSWSPIYSFVTIYVTEIKEMSGRKSDLCKLKMLLKILKL